MQGLLFFALLLVQGCAVGPDYKPVKTEMPDAWHQQLIEGLATGQQIPLKWWNILDDPLLNELIESARENNPDLKTAYWSVVETRAQRDFVAGKYYPNVDAIGSYNRIRQSENGVNSLFGSGFSIPPYDLYNAGVDSSWEIDLFGRTKRSVESAQASLEAEIENFHDILIVLYSDVATSYVDLRSAQERIKYALENIKSQRATLDLTQTRFDAGLAPELDVEQAKLNLANTESKIPSLRIEEKTAINRLSVLIGKKPGELFETLAKFSDIPEPPQDIAIHLPAELLRQRPDVRRAERLLAAQTAQIGVATADLYPTFSLSGYFALEALEFSDMGKMSSRAYSFGPSLRWNIFDADRIKNNIRIQEARTQQLFSQYQFTVLNALEETENSITDYAQETQRRKSLYDSVEAAQNSVKLVQTLYRSGLTDFQNVLDMQRTLVFQQDQFAQSRGNVTLNLIRIYRSLGGGWDDDILKQKPDPSDNEQMIVTVD